MKRAPREVRRYPAPDRRGDVIACDNGERFELDEGRLAVTPRGELPAWLAWGWPAGGSAQPLGVEPFARWRFLLHHAARRGFLVQTADDRGSLAHRLRLVMRARRAEARRVRVADDCRDGLLPEGRTCPVCGTTRCWQGTCWVHPRPTPRPHGGLPVRPAHPRWRRSGWRAP